MKFDFLDNWNKKKEKNKEYENKFSEINFEAKIQAMTELKPELVKIHKEKELEKAKKKSSNWGESLGKEFKEMGDGFLSRDNIDRVINTNTGKKNKSNNDDSFTEDRIKRML